MEQASLARGADWDMLAAEAGPGLLPWVADRVAALGIDATLPDEVRARLAGARRAAAMAALLRRRTLGTALDALGSAGIEAVVLKGAALAWQVYPDPALRPMQDMDLWLPASPVDPAADALRTAGFRFPGRTFAGRQGPTEEDPESDVVLEWPGTPMLVELHSRLASLARLPIERLEFVRWRLAETSLGGIKAQVLHPDDQLLHVALHLGLRHRFAGGLQGLLDLRLLVEHYRDWDWPALAADHQVSGVAPWMYLALRLAHDLVGAPVADDYFTSQPEPTALAEMTRLAQAQLWGGPPALPAAIEQMGRETSGSGRSTWLRQRLGAYFRRPEGAGWWESTREVGRRISFDLRVKVPRYLARWRRGDLRGSGLEEQLALSEGRRRLAELADTEVRADTADDKERT